jgi:hypothetical protein
MSFFPRTERKFLSGDLPQWKCHKIVGAAKILTVFNEGAKADAPEKSHASIVVQVPNDKITVIVEQEWIDKFKPKIGGFLVMYADNYMSFSPETVFMAGYKRIPEVEQVEQKA